MTLKTRLRIPAAQNARVADQPPSANEGAGNAGCAARTHGPVYKSKKVHEPQVTTGQAATPAFPANGFNGFLRALPGDRAFLPPSPADHLRQLDASVGASGPHDFAVRFTAHSSDAQPSVHRIPHSTFVTIGQTPLQARRDARLNNGVS